MKIFIKKNILGFAMALAFFIIGVLTLSQYGLNIDEPIHFIRGHAYLTLLTKWRSFYTPQELISPRVSDWKIQGYNGAYFLENDSGHPALNGILAAASNRIFYEKLGILGDLESYHVFEIFVSSLLVFLVYFMTANEWGRFAGIAAALAIFLYPLFLGESRFNIKDPIETTFFAYTVYFLYLGIKGGKAKWFLHSGVWGALAFATKFNIIFLPFIILPYIFVRFRQAIARYRLGVFKKIPLTVYGSLILSLIIMLAIHLATRPYLWLDPIGRFMQIVGYYQGIGTGKFYQPSYIIKGWNIYPLIFVIASTPLVTLGLAAFGILYGWVKLRTHKNAFYILLLLWFTVPILRVMWPGSSIYSGVRQIMEYIPPFAILAGLGALVVRNIVSKITGRVSIASVMTLALFLPLSIKLWQMHPNENVFLNVLVGGLTGAVEKKIPGSAETMGNVYVQGVQWLNNHAESNARFGLPVGLASNIPRQFLRSDIGLGAYFSGAAREGEYMMEMISVDFPPERYNFLYLDRFLEPVHEVVVDGVSLLKIWKNDLAHTRSDYTKEKEVAIRSVEGGVLDGYLHINLSTPARITKLVVDHPETDCVAQGSGEVLYGLDSNNVLRSPDDYYGMQGPYARKLQTPTRFVYFFPGTLTRWIRLVPAEENLCFLSYTNITVSALAETEQ